jgi:hypothetical protein
MPLQLGAGETPVGLAGSDSCIGGRRHGNSIIAPA